MYSDNFSSVSADICISIDVYICNVKHDSVHEIKCVQSMQGKRLVRLETSPPDPSSCCGLQNSYDQTFPWVALSFQQ